MVAVAPNLNEVVKSLLSKCTHLNHIKQLQSFLTTLGYAHTNFYTFKLLRFCFLNLSNLTYARLIFDHHPFPNIYLYTTMITAYASLPDHDSAFSLYRHMLRNGHPTPNHFIFPHVLKSSQRTRLVHAHIEKSGFDDYPQRTGAKGGSSPCNTLVWNWTANSQDKLKLRLLLGSCVLQRTTSKLPSYEYDGMAECLFAARGESGIVVICP
ncbi:hypothetical protein Tsubulata_008908 [Turnera subulata]|uniref:Pentatricopeptide repeat-containing protein n=1 Tax=Turnera subulata TaxID=218843 RepID=A0A9Q0FC61_9ROSI|nr:hypothetical protein Tsubulata_008908 [Turnera subulata]